MRTMLLIALLAASCTGCARAVEPSTPPDDRVPQVTDIPESWCASEYDVAGGADDKRSLTVIAPDGMMNVIASSEPLDADIDTSDYATSQGELLRHEFPEFEELDSSPSEAFGDGIDREFRWTPPDADPVWQVQAYRVVDQRGYVSTGTAPEDAPERVRQMLRRAVAGARIVDRADAVVPERC